MTAPLPNEERLRRARRDAAEYRRRSLHRRSQGRLFYGYLDVVPQVFLRPGAVRSARLVAPPEAVIRALEGRVAWTLDTAARLRFGVGLLRTGDLHAYVPDERAIEEAASSGLVEPSAAASPSIDPVAPRPPLLIARVDRPAPPSVRLDDGSLVVTGERLVEDLFGALGWRPDLLARLEAAGLRRRGPDEDDGAA